jgi:hypothetical protein
MTGTTPRRAASKASLPPLITVLLCLALIPTPALAQPPVPGATAVPPVPATVRPAPRFIVSAERIRIDAPTQQRVGSGDSLRNGAILGAVIGAAAFGAFAATLCRAYRESGGASCVPDTVKFAAIGGAIGAGAGVAVDAARGQRGITVRLAIRF